MSTTAHPNSAAPAPRFRRRGAGRAAPQRQHWRRADTPPAWSHARRSASQLLPVLDLWHADLAVVVEGGSDAGRCPALALVEAAGPGIVVEHPEDGRDETFRPESFLDVVHQQRRRPAAPAVGVHVEGPHLPATGEAAGTLALGTVRAESDHALASAFRRLGDDRHAVTRPEAPVRPER